MEAVKTFGEKNKRLPFNKIMKGFEEKCPTFIG